MQNHAFKGFAVILCCVTLGCQRTPQLNPIEKIKTSNFRQLERLLQRQAQQFSSSVRFQMLVNGESPAVSPNGQYIAFSGDGVDGKDYIWIIDSDGNNLKQITTLGRDYSPQWSPDGKSILFQSYGLKNWFDPRNWWGDTRQSQIWIVDIESRKQRQVTLAQTEPDRYPFWSPDGQQLAWFRGDQLWVASANGQNSRSLTTTQHNIPPRRYTWSSQDQIIVSQPELSSTTDTPSPLPLQCTKQLSIMIDMNGQSESRLEYQPFEPIFREKVGPFHYCVDQGHLFKVDAKNKTSQIFERFAPMFFEHATVDPDHKKFVIGLVVKGGNSSILILTLDE